MPKEKIAFNEITDNKNPNTKLLALHLNASFQPNSCFIQQISKQNADIDTMRTAM